MIFGNATVSLEYSAINFDQLINNSDFSLIISLKEITAMEANKLLEGQESLRLAGSIYEFSAGAIDSANNLKEIKFNSSIKLSIPLSLSLYKEGAANGTLKAYFHDAANSTWEVVAGVYNSETNAIAFEASSFGKFALLEKVTEIAQSNRFKDIGAHWAANDIQYMADRGYINGATPDLFAPDSQVTRQNLLPC
ncbi:hypothetical protein N752_00140 [Desulforamulus aquiferis]|nr:S-layer homology domain-containing protein [Desulforamulus aquiferis]RYD07023.1 hypothetical protein N752_00140 [Desulforamulus aquiferis]